MIPRILFVILVAALPVKPEEWTWSTSISSDRAGSGFVRVEVTPEMAASSQPDLADLRIVDEQNSMVPFVVQTWNASPLERLSWRDAALINRVYVPNDHSQVTLDFGEPVRKSVLKIGLTGANFRRRVAIEAGTDNQVWQRLGDDFYLFRIPVPQTEDIVVDTVTLPENDYRYLRLTVYNMPDDRERIDIQSVRAALKEKKEGPAPVLIADVTVSGPLREKETPYTGYELDTQSVNMPLARLEIKIPDPYFYVPYEILGRNTRSEKVPVSSENGNEFIVRDTAWERMASGVFYRIEHPEKHTEQLTADLPRGAFRYLQVRLFEKDNPPVTVQEFAVYRRPIYLAFDYKPEHQYRLIGGNAKAVPPEFTLAQAVTSIKEQDLPLALTQPLTLRQPPETIPPWTQRYQIIIWAALFTMVSLMVLLILMNLPALRQKE